MGKSSLVSCLLSLTLISCATIPLQTHLQHAAYRGTVRAIKASLKISPVDQNNGRLYIISRKDARPRVEKYFDGSSFYQTVLGEHVSKCDASDVSLVFVPAANAPVPPTWISCSDLDDLIQSIERSKKIDSKMFELEREYVLLGKNADLLAVKFSDLQGQTNKLTKLALYIGALQDQQAESILSSSKDINVVATAGQKIATQVSAISENISKSFADLEVSIAKLQASVPK